MRKKLGANKWRYWRRWRGRYYSDPWKWRKPPLGILNRFKPGQPASLRFPKLVLRRLLKRRAVSCARRKKGANARWQRQLRCETEMGRRTSKALERLLWCRYIRTGSVAIGVSSGNEGALAKGRQWLPVVHRKDPWIHYHGSGRRCIRDGFAAVGGVSRQMELDGLIWLPVSTVVRAKRGLYAMKSIIRHGGGAALKSSDEFRAFIMVYSLFMHLHGRTQGG